MVEDNFFTLMVIDMKVNIKMEKNQEKVNINYLICNYNIINVFNIGIYFYQNGDQYEGEWKNDKRNGIGTLYLLNGDKYFFLKK